MFRVGMARIIMRSDAGSVALRTGKKIASFGEHAGALTGGAGLRILYVVALVHGYSYSMGTGLFTVVERIPSLLLSVPILRLWRPCD